MKVKPIATFRRDKINQQNLAPIYIRFTLDRKSRYLTTGIMLSESDWDFEKGEIKPCVPNAKQLQYKIDTKINFYLKRIAKLEALEVEITLDTLLERNGRKDNYTVEDYFKRRIKRLEGVGKIGTASKYFYCHKLLKQCNDTSIRFDQVDMQYLRNFELFLINKGNASNSIATKFSVLKAVYNSAIADGLFTPTDNPFTKFKVGRLWKPTRKRAISKEEIIKLKELELPEDSTPFYMRFARDIFLFSYYTAGMNFKDIATLRFSDIDNGRLHYARHKTSKELSCFLIPEAKAIIDRYASPFYDDSDYIFPIINVDRHVTEQQIYNRVHKVLSHVNRNLGVLSKQIGLKTPITTYVARHTFATVLKRSGVDIAIISESLGHSDLSTTEIYLDSFENTQIDEAMKNLL